VETRRLGLCNACDANSVATKMKDRHRNECSKALFVRQVHQLVAKYQIKKTSCRKFVSLSTTVYTDVAQYSDHAISLAISELLSSSLQRQEYFFFLQSVQTDSGSDVISYTSIT